MLFTEWDCQTAFEIFSLLTIMVLCFIQQPVKNTLPVEDVYEVMSGVPTEQEVSEQLAKGRSVHSPSVNMLP